MAMNLVTGRHVTSKGSQPERQPGLVRPGEVVRVPANKATWGLPKLAQGRGG